MADNVTAEDIKNFYLDGREIVICMQAIALWIFQEWVVVNKLLDEALICLGWVESVTPPVPAVNVSDMTLTARLMGGKPTKLMLVYRNRMNVITKVNETVFGSFAIAFEDIIQEVSGMSFAQLNVLPLMQNLHVGHEYPYHYPQQAAPTVDAPSAYTSVLPNHTALDKEERLPEMKRAIFFKFTRENPIQPKELENRLEGCIQKITMQQVRDNEHPSWASVVFYSEIPVLAIMQGRETEALSKRETRLGWKGMVVVI
ncbi:hypothetical protein MKX01_027031 [Papaver californicum]|nr:hypothetical protein MKX01_027031 [Papaver californicum]